MKNNLYSKSQNLGIILQMKVIILVIYMIELYTVNLTPLIET